MARYYTYDNREDLFFVQKYLDGKIRKLARVRTEEDAKKVVAALQEVEWDRRRLPDEIKDLILNSFRDKTPYYTLTPGGKYQVQKRVRGVQTHFGNYDTEAEAIAMVNKLKMCRWEKDILELLLKIDEEQEIKRIRRQTRGKKNKYKRRMLGIDV
ncbi:hypothetical protein [Methanobrevibacter sp.]|uniref:hypothetical protein n=1 Tax=Methanobrevibacter sp. TaxID=66852 RepID=UPI0038666309